MEHHTARNQHCPFWWVSFSLPGNLELLVATSALILVPINPGPGATNPCVQQLPTGQPHQGCLSLHPGNGGVNYGCPQTPTPVSLGIPSCPRAERSMAQQPPQQLFPWDDVCAQQLQDVATLKQHSGVTLEHLVMRQRCYKYMSISFEEYSGISQRLFH